jgi:hypothetical protein
MGTENGKPALRRYFIDTEFKAIAGKPGFHPVTLISFAMISEDDREFYAVYDGVDPEECARDNPWLADNVLKKLPPREEWKSLDYIRDHVLDMIEPAETIEIWARNGSYDNLMICSLFGDMSDLRGVLKEKKGIEKVVFRDTHELRRIFGEAAVPPQPEETKHICIDDARQEKKEYDYWQTLPKAPGP